MKQYLILAPIFLFALLQGAFLQINLVLLAVLLLAVFLPAKESLWIAFISGLFLDLAKGTPLGASSFVLLVTCYLLLLYSRRFNASYPPFLAVFVSLGAAGWSRIFQSFLNFKEALVLGILTFVFTLACRFFGFPTKRIKI